MPAMTAALRATEEGSLASPAFARNVCVLGIRVHLRRRPVLAAGHGIGRTILTYTEGERAARWQRPAAGRLVAAEDAGSFSGIAYGLGAAAGLRLEIGGFHGQMPVHGGKRPHLSHAQGFRWQGPRVRSGDFQVFIDRAAAVAGTAVQVEMAVATDHGQPAIDLQNGFGARLNERP
jgi:hypothetical protein